MTCCVILLEVAIRRWRHCAHKGMDMVSSNTQVSCGVDAQLVLMDSKKIYPTPLHIHTVAFFAARPFSSGLIIKAFAPTELPLTGYFLFVGAFSVNPRDGCV